MESIAIKTHEMTSEASSRRQSQRLATSNSIQPVSEAHSFVQGNDSKKYRLTFPSAPIIKGKG
jgi:hypothetical protein